MLPLRSCRGRSGPQQPFHSRILDPPRAPRCIHVVGRFGSSRRSLGPARQPKRRRRVQRTRPTFRKANWWLGIGSGFDLLAMFVQGRLNTRQREKALLEYGGFASLPGPCVAFSRILHHGRAAPFHPRQATRRSFINGALGPGALGAPWCRLVVPVLPGGFKILPDRPVVRIKLQRFLEAEDGLVVSAFSGLHHAKVA